MATRPPLNPKSTVSATILPASGSSTNVAAACPIGVYTASAGFLQGASDQVGYVYKKLGGDVLDIELTEGNIYAAYEESCLEYSYIVNIHQSKNVLSDVLGDATGSFNSDGELISSGSQPSALSASLGGDRVELKYPNFQFSYARKVGQALSNEVNVGGFDTVYSASISVTASIQDYDLQAIVYSASVDSDNSGVPYYNKIGKNKILIRKVYYKTPAASWRFYGYYGGLNTVGNLQSYGQYADDSQFQIVPVWQNKQQALMFEDAIYTRNSHYSYEIKNNKLRVFPSPPSAGTGPTKYWIEFVIPNEHNAWDQNNQRMTNTDGINNMNSIPFANIPYDKINSIGKQWIRRFGLALSKEMLGHVRSKFASIPIPGESITLNGSDLVSQAKEEQTALREELKTVLDEMTYDKLVEKDAGIVANVGTMQEKLPMGIFTG